MVVRGSTPALCLQAHSSVQNQISSLHSTDFLSKASPYLKIEVIIKLEQHQIGIQICKSHTTLSPRLGSNMLISGVNVNEPSGVWRKIF